MDSKYLINKEIEILDWTGEKFEYKGMYRKRVIGDGSCYFHSIIDAYFLPVRTGFLDGKLFNRFDFVKKFRFDLSNMLSLPRPGYDGKTYYETLSRGKLKDRSKSGLPVSLSDMVEGLRSNNPVGYIYHELISDILSLDIYILNYEKKDIYMIDSDFYYKDRKSIVILYIPGHFEVVGVMRSNELKTYFEPQDDFIRKIRSRIKNLTNRVNDEIKK